MTYRSVMIIEVKTSLKISLFKKKKESPIRIDFLTRRLRLEVQYRIKSGCKIDHRLQSRSPRVRYSFEGT